MGRKMQDKAEEFRIPAETLAAIRAARFRVIASRFNHTIVDALIERAGRTFAEYEIPGDRIGTVFVPGAFEIPQAARMLASRGGCDAIIAFGCVIRGETAHFDSVAGACTEGLARVAQDFTIPVAHGVLLCENYEQALRRVARGAEAAEAAIRMLALVHGLDGDLPYGNG